MVASIVVDTAHIRPVDPRRDLLAIADLIEICFKDQMDDEGREYVRQIRHAAHSGDFFRWMNGADETISLPLGGFVWVEGQRVVGNLTMIPYRANAHEDGAIHWRYLIANVAVHPDFRRQGIGRQLTIKALEHIHNRRAGAWLQVRDDNPPAQALYLQLGFVEQARRTTWEASNAASFPDFPDRLVIDQRRRDDWALQSTWLRRTYPPEVAWNLGFRLKRLEPGFWRFLTNLFTEAVVSHWVVRRGKKLIGAASWDPGAFRAENLWLCADPDDEEEALYALLAEARRSLIPRRPLTVNYPAGQGTIAFDQAGFFKQTTLIWMEHKD